ncbi:MAG: hypothetical protein PHG66_01785 [Candidatus Colwellbacteria bacterium]|nr:hypothetical protein [Candidatus Colwellbacteria bacterium]
MSGTIDIRTDLCILEGISVATLIDIDHIVIGNGKYHLRDERLCFLSYTKNVTKLSLFDIKDDEMRMTIPCNNLSSVRISGLSSSVVTDSMGSYLLFDQK